MKHRLLLAMLLASGIAQAASPYIHKVYDFMPAPGQFINELPEYEPGDTKQDMIRKVEECLVGEEKILVSLGGYGGYVVFGFDHLVENKPGKYDFKIWSNAFYAHANPNLDAPKEGGSCEPGIVMVACDANDNGLPDDEWYELAGSEYRKPETIHHYAITYYKPDENKLQTPDNDYPFLNDTTYVKWTSNQGDYGYVSRNTFYSQPYYPQWITDETIVFEGTKLADNYVDESDEGSYYVQYACDWGYADNHPNTDNRSGFSIEWAVDKDGNRVRLPGIHFVKVYTGVNQYCGWLGETSTEIMGAEDLHLTGKDEEVAAGYPIDYAKGVFLLNEDWFGHTNSSLNFLTEEGDMAYRVYTKENPGEAFGCTAQYATVYGGKLYVVSKQEADLGDMDYIPGGRLVIADAKTLKKIKGLDRIGGYDGRAFLGVDENTAYISTTNGIFRFDLQRLELKERIAGTEGSLNLYSAQTGIMLRAGDYVFACKQNEGILVIDAHTHTLYQTIPDKNISTLTQSKDGQIWAAVGTAFLKINPFTLQTERIDFPQGVSLIASWPAWNAGSLCASLQENVLYFTNQGNFGFDGELVRKYDIDKQEFNTAFFTLPAQVDEDGKRLKYRQTFYGAGLRVDPLSNRLIITTTETGADSHYQNNWIHLVDGMTGELVKTIELSKYYWFPAMPFFPDNYSPEITGLNNAVDLDGNESQSIYLGDKVRDADNLDAAIIKSVISNSNPELLMASIRQDSLLLIPAVNKSGKAEIVLRCNSNGLLTEKVITVHVGAALGIQEEQSAVGVYPNPVTTLLTVAASVGEPISLTDMRGYVLYKAVATAEETTIYTGNLSNGIYILKVGSKSFKINKH
ncbi:DUF5074 domain-containing protein [Viscerimonas tarda]